MPVSCHQRTVGPIHYPGRHSRQCVGQGFREDNVTAKLKGVRSWALTWPQSSAEDRSSGLVSPGYSSLPLHSTEKLPSFNVLCALHEVFWE